MSLFVAPKNHGVTSVFNSHRKRSHSSPGKFGNAIAAHQVQTKQDKIIMSLPEIYSTKPLSELSHEFICRNFQLLAIKSYDYWQKHGSKTILLVSPLDVNSVTFSPVAAYIQILLDTRKSILEYTGVSQSEHPLVIESIRREAESKLMRINPETQLVIQLVGCPEVENLVILSFDTPIPYYWIKHRKASEAKPKRNHDTERQLEIDLQAWLLALGVDVESQVATSKHRLDLWIPGKLMIELKAGKVSGDDVCQAIDYHATYQRKILLVGKGLSDSATRGIDGFNRSIQDDAILFVTWGAVKPYLKAYLGIK